MRASTAWRAHGSLMVSMLDIAPTILDLAGAPVPADIQGASIKPMFKGLVRERRDAIYYHYYGVEGKPRPGNYIAHHEVIGARTASERIVFYPTWKDGPFWECFDLGADPLEMNSLIHKPEYSVKVTKMKERLRSLAIQYEDDKVLGYLGADGEKEN